MHAKDLAKKIRRQFVVLCVGHIRFDGDGAAVHLFNEALLALELLLHTPFSFNGEALVIEKLDAQANQWVGQLSLVSQSDQCFHDTIPSCCLVFWEPMGKKRMCSLYNLDSPAFFQRLVFP